MKRSLPLVLALAVVLLGIAPLSASAAMPENAVAIKLGGYFPQADDVDDFDTGLNVEISFTHYFHPNFALELGVGYFKSEDDFDDKLTSYPITLNLKAVYPVGGIELYALGGIGAYYAKLEVPFLGFDENDTVLGYQLGVGANFNITPIVYIGAEAKYFWAKPDFAGVEIKIDGLQATANLGYRF
jgi:opacity protein-like surface antigen